MKKKNINKLIVSILLITTNNTSIRRNIIEQKGIEREQIEINKNLKYTESKGTELLLIRRKDYTNSLDKEIKNKDVNLLGDTPDKLFEKPGVYSKEKSKRKNSRTSIINRELTFRQRITKKDGKEQRPSGASDPQDPQNMDKFESMGIPLDKMRDKRQKPDRYNT